MINDKYDHRLAIGAKVLTIAHKFSITAYRLVRTADDSWDWFNWDNLQELEEDFLNVVTDLKQMLNDRDC